MQPPSEFPPEQQKTRQRAESTLDRAVHGLLWLLLAITIGLNTWLNLLGYHLLAVVFGFVAIGSALILFIRFLRRRSS